MHIVEYDHTSSGVQIAAALAKDEKTASVVNINGGAVKRDLYTEVFKATNQKLKALGSDIKLTRKDVKKAVIATIYGGKHKTVYGAFEVATGLSLNEQTKPLFQAFAETIKEQLSGVVTVQKYFERIAKSVHETGSESVAITLPNGALFEVFFKEGEAKASETVGYTPDFKAGSLEVKAQYEYKTGKDNVTGTAKTLVAGFVQSFDAYLLARVQIELSKAGIAFHAKHDAYLISEQDVPALVAIVKQVFFETFQTDYLTVLRNEIEARYGVDVGAFSGFGSYSVSAVLESDFLISQ